MSEQYQYSDPNGGHSQYSNTYFQQAPYPDQQVPVGGIPSNTIPPEPTKGSKKIWGLRRATFFLSLAIVLLFILMIALGVGLGVGLTRRNSNQSQAVESNTVTVLTEPSRTATSSVRSSSSSSISTSSTSSSTTSETPSETPSPTPSPTSEPTPPRLPTRSTTSSRRPTPTTSESVCNPSQTVLANPDFDDGSSSPNLDPWYIDSDGAADWQFQTLGGEFLAHTFQARATSSTTFKLAQELNTCEDVQYDLIFDRSFASSDPEAVSIRVTIDGFEILTTEGGGGGGYQTVTASFTAVSDTSLLELEFLTTSSEEQEFFVDSFKVSLRL